MISNVHYIELFVNKECVELESQDSLNLRINNVLFNPTKTTTNQAEYSFSFQVPSTPKNDRIFGYANNLSKTNKFHARYPAEVYADGNVIFEGSLTVQKYKAKDKMYECNLVNIKINTLEDIFGDAVLTDVPWLVDYSGVTTINEVNEDPTSKFWFPLVCYGAFLKNPSSIDAYGVSNEYTSKYSIDSTNYWYLSSFYPSLNMLEQMKKCFEWKGYKVGGDALFDPIISNVYCSTQLADEQQPEYNVGNPKFGKVEMNVSWTGDTNTLVLGTNTWSQTLKLPYFPIGGGYDLLNQVDKTPSYNFSEIFISPLIKEGTVTLSQETSMYVPDRGIIVIPADGWYKISLSATTTLNQPTNLTATQFVHPWNGSITAMSDSVEEEVITFAADLAISTPIEIQLIKNYDENIELIKGKNCIEIKDGNPSHTTECNQGRDSNYFNYMTCFPHENASLNWMYAYGTDVNAISDASSNRSDCNIGYMYADGELMCYDPVVSDAFICGFTTMGNKNAGGCCAFRKDGYSWSKTYTERTDAMYKQQGYNKLNYNSNWEIVSERTTRNFNQLKDSPNNTFAQFGNTCSASVNGMIYLKKNDVLELMAVRRAYWNGGLMVKYGANANVKLTIEAASPNNRYTLKAEDYGWNSPTEFPTMLNLMNFTNKEKKIYDWIKNVQEAFNLSFDMHGNNVDININKGIKKTITYAVDIDDRVNKDEASAEYISYPREMSVKYKIDTEEHGFYESVPKSHINDSDWKDWGDSGFTVIQLSDDSYETTTQNKQVNFSYTWYDSFTYVASPLDAPQQMAYGMTLPVISKEEYMIDGYDYEEAIKHDGYSLEQRFWFRTNKQVGAPLDIIVAPISDDWYYSDGRVSNRSVTIYAPTNIKDGTNLSYKSTEKSLVTEYFNIHPMLASNYVTVDVFLNPIEYINIKNGALVHYDSDLYYTSEISGYDPSGWNQTTLKLIKKV